MWGNVLECVWGGEGEGMGGVRKVRRDGGVKKCGGQEWESA